MTRRFASVVQTGLSPTALDKLVKVACQTRSAGSCALATAWKETLNS